MLSRSTVSKSFNPYGKETATFQTKAYYVTDIGAIVFRHQLTSALSSLSLISSSQNAARRGDENCIELRERSHLRNKSIINYDLDIMNFLVISPQIRYIEVFDITNPQFNGQIWSVPSDFVKSRFHCKHTGYFREKSRRPSLVISTIITTLLSKTMLTYISVWHIRNNL